MITLVAPILLQNLLSSSLNFIDVFMIGRLGETSIAAVGSANQFFFLVLMIVFGLASGSAIFTAQFWGKKDIKNIRATMGIGLILTIGLTLVITILTLTFPRFIIKMFSDDPAVISMGMDYIKIIAWSFVIMSISISFSTVLRSTENVIYPMAASIVGIFMNTGLNFLLIFGNFGFPALGAKGAAYATLISRTIEMLLVLFFTYWKKLPAAAGLADLFKFTSQQMKKYIAKALPVVLQSAGWSLGFSMFTMIFGHINTESLASYTIAGTIQRISLIFFTGLASACSIMVGNRIGADEPEKARGYAGNFLMISFGLSLVISLALFLLRDTLVGLYELNELSRSYMRGILLVMSCILWAKALNITFHMGIFKAGGDTLFSMFVDVGGMWLIGVPMAAICAFYFKMPVHIILAFLTIEETLKVLVGLWRFRSGKWVVNLVSNSEEN